MTIKHLHFLILSVSIHLFMLAGFKNSRNVTVYSKNVSSNFLQKTSVYLRKKESNTFKKREGRGELLSKANKAPEIQETELATIEAVKSSGDENKKARYINEVRKLIIKNKKYPRIAQRLKQEGVVELSFKIEKSNKIKDLEIVEASSFESLNQAALEAVESIDLAELEFPKDLPSDWLEIQLPMQFDLL